MEEFIVNCFSVIEKSLVTYFKLISANNFLGKSDIFTFSSHLRKFKKKRH